MDKKIYLFLIGTTLASSLFVSSAFGYGVETHAYLTKETVAFYNKNFPGQKLSQELADYLIDGARQEDNAPRFLNHFYDPVNNRGLADGAYRGRKSKDWAQNKKSQTALLYKLFPDTEKSILTASQLDKIKLIYSKTDFTWQKAIKLYAEGEIEQALFALGHIVHLIEDASVPDHTRNDAHPPYDDGGSPYENWTHKFDLENPDQDLTGRLKNKKPILLGNLDTYFDEMATYSNNNFYSRDSVDIYELPKSEKFQKIGNYKYALWNDGEGYYHLVAYVDNEDFIYTPNELSKPFLKEEKGELKILPDYWSRLSTKSVQYAAGVVNLFLQEAEAAKEKLALQKAQRPYLATLTDGFKKVFGNSSDESSDEFELAAEIPITQPKVEKKPESKPESRTQATVPAPLPEIETEIVPLQLQSAAPVNILPQLACSFSTSQAPSRQTVIINEVAWMGTHESSNNEWFELKNIGGNPINISGWQILDKDEQIKVVIPIGAALPVGGFYLLERNSDAVVSGIFADLIYEASGNGAPSLKNTDEGLRLFDKNCNLIDEVFANSEWPAGDSSARRAMERSADLSWHTYLGGGENGILGTPRKENSLPPSVVSYGGSSGSYQSSSAQNNQAAQEVASSPVKILITEVQITGGTGKSDNDFIEIYNLNDSAVNLKGYRLVKRTKDGVTDTSIKSWTEDVIIQPKSFYLWANSNHTDIAVSPDVTTSATVASDNGVAIRFGGADQGTIIDSVGFGEAQNGFVEGQVFPTNPPANQSIQRKIQNNDFLDTNNNATDFEVQNCPSPKTQERTCSAGQSNQAPSAFFDYASKDPKVGDSITFNAASSTDPDGSIAFYQWDFGDGATTTAAQPTAAHSYSAANNYLVQLTVLDNQNASSTATSTAVSVNLAAVSNTNVNHIVISEVQVAGIDAGDEFIEIYNSTDNEIDLSGWSVQYLSGTASSTDSIFKKNFEIGNKISAKGFFLIARSKSNNADGYAGSKTPDLTHRTFSMSGSSSGAKIFLVNDQEKISALDDGNVIDKLDYSFSVPPAGQSLERKAFQSGSCVSAQNAGEYLGNGCDTNNDASDLELRATPNPQNTQSLPEPRSAPAAVQNFNISYSPSNLELTFSWDTNQALLYIIADISGAVPEVLNQVTTSGATKKISEIGRQYKFEITAKDSEGLSSIPTQAAINIPSFLSTVSFYQDANSTATPKYLLELDWSSYPFIPIKLKHLVSKQYVSNSWHAAIFYYNQNAPETDDLFWINYDNNAVYKSWGLTAPGGFKIKYPNCLGSNYETAGASLIFPETINDCSSLAGNHSSYALKWNQLEDNHLLLTANSENFATSAPVANQDYITAAFYAYQPGYEPNNYGLKLLAVDKNKYYFQNTAANHQPPTAPSNVVFDFDSQLSLLKVSWDKSTDPDTLDNLITYEISYNGASTSTAGNNFMEILAEPAATYDFELRAKDDFGNLSSVTAVSYDVPEIPLQYELTDISWGHFDGLDSVALSLEFNEYPFMDDDAPSAMIFFLNQPPPANYSFLDDDYRNGANMGGSNNFLKLSYFPCDFNGTWINKRTVGGAIFNNADCPTNSSLAMSKLLLAKLDSDDIQFTAEVINNQEFSEDDYITIGFYKLEPLAQNGAAYFTNIANYNKKIYFQP